MEETRDVYPEINELLRRTAPGTIQFDHETGLAQAKASPILTHSLLHFQFQVAFSIEFDGSDAKSYVTVL